MGIGILLIVLLAGLRGAATLWHDGSLRADLRARGVPAAEVLSAKGTCYTIRKNFSREPGGCNLNISYRLRPEEGGRTLTAKVRLDGKQPIFTPPALYDPADPSRVMLEPEVKRDVGWSTYVARVNGTDHRGAAGADLLAADDQVRAQGDY